MQDLQQGLLDQPIRNSRYPQFPQAAPRFRNLHPTDRLRPIASRLQFFPQSRPVGLEKLSRRLDGQSIRPGTASIGFDAFPRQHQILSREHLPKQIASPRAFLSLSRRPYFIASDTRQGFTLPSFGSPRLPGLLMPCTTKRHARRLSFSFGPSLHFGSYYGLC